MWSDERAGNLNPQYVATPQPSRVAEDWRVNGLPAFQPGGYAPAQHDVQSLTAPRTRFLAWAKQKQASKVNEWGRVLQMGEFARQVNAAQHHEAYAYETRRQQVDAELHVEAAHAFWWLRLWNNVSTNGVMLVLGVTLALVGLLAWTTLLEVESMNQGVFRGRLLPESWVRAKPPAKLRDQWGDGRERISTVGRTTTGGEEVAGDWDPLDPYKHIRGGQVLPLTGDVGQLEDGTLVAGLPPVGYYSHASSLTLLRQPVDTLVCSWVATHGDVSAIMLSWWKPGSPRWTKPVVLWKDDHPNWNGAPMTWERPVLLANEWAAGGEPRPPSLTLLFTARHGTPQPPAPKPPPAAPPAYPGAPGSPTPAPPPHPTSARRRRKADEAYFAAPPSFPARWNVPGRPAAPDFPNKPAPPPPWPKHPSPPGPWHQPPSPRTPRPPRAPISPDAPLQPLTHVMLMRSKQFDVGVLTVDMLQRGNVDSGRVPMVWSEPREHDGSAGLRLNGAPVSALEWWGYGWLVPATVHVAMDGIQQPEFSVLRLYDEDMDPRREFVLTTKREGLVHPAVALLVASVVPDLMPPAPPRPPAHSIGAGFMVGAPEAPPNPRPPPSKILVALFSSLHGVEELRRVHRAVSLDGGQTWTQPMRTSLPNFRTPVAVTSLVSGALVCVFTNMLVEESHGSSTPAEQKTIVLSAALSYDAGVTWPFVRDLQPRFEPGFNYAEPSVVGGTNAERAHVSYTQSFYDQEWGMKRQSKIVFMSITEEWIKGTWSTGVSSKGLFRGDVRTGDNTESLDALSRLVHDTPKQVQRHGA